MLEEAMRHAPRNVPYVGKWVFVFEWKHDSSWVVTAARLPLSGRAKIVFEFVEGYLPVLVVLFVVFIQAVVERLVFQLISILFSQERQFFVICDVTVCCVILHVPNHGELDILR